jgi:hypothetical protein
MLADTIIRPDPVADAAVAPDDPTPVTVLIADDHPLFRRGMARAIARHPGLRSSPRPRTGARRSSSSTRSSRTSPCSTTACPG